MKLSDVKPLDLDAHLGKAKNRVALVSVELEGGWIQLPAGVGGLEHDGSVFNGRIPAGAKHIGELPIGPARPAGILDLIKANHPQKTNATCGMHIHMSFDTLRHYHLLMVPEYQKSIITYLGQWAKENNLKETHPIWDRLAGKSRYCKEEFWPDAQAATKRKGHDMNVHGHRYTIIHYCGRLGTIECRVLPMMGSTKLATSAVQRVIDITNACIFVLGKVDWANKEQQFKSKIDLPADLIYEETVIEEM